MAHQCRLDQILLELAGTKEGSKFKYRLSKESQGHNIYMILKAYNV